nr:hypothetical protein JVH1_6622 [Rhodococcus sp. JVH1]
MNFFRKATLSFRAIPSGFHDSAEVACPQMEHAMTPTNCDARRRSELGVMFAT